MLCHFSYLPLFLFLFCFLFFFKSVLCAGWWGPCRVEVSAAEGILAGRLPHSHRYSSAQLLFGRGVGGWGSRGGGGGGAVELALAIGHCLMLTTA